MTEVDIQEIDQSSQGINMISLNPDVCSTYDHSADDFSVNMMDAADDPTTSSKLHIQYRHRKFWVMVDSGVSTSIVTEQMTKDIEAEDSNTLWSRKINPVQLKS